MTRRLVFAVSVAAAFMCAPVGAGAATPMGEAFSPSDPCPTGTYLQTTSPASSFEVPIDGVLTSWAFYNNPSGPTRKLKIARPSGGNAFSIIADTATEPGTVFGVNSFPIRIGVRAGDVIGLHVAANPGGQCGRDAQAGYAAHFLVGDQAPGTTGTYASQAGRKLDVSAVLEPDADGDGYGDETQDQCPSSAATQNECVAPETTITTGPKDKTKKKAATFEFSGTDARALAGFECSLDGGAFAACTSPHTVKVKKGKHTFSVRATDQAGNVDGAPASDSWKVKKKKK